jgi:glycosyltransferase involved in cell wall biosynthesis
MRVVFDCRSIHPEMGGIGQTTWQLIRALPEALRGHDILALRGPHWPKDLAHETLGCDFIDVDAAMIDPAFEQYRLPNLLRRVNGDLYHNPCYALPVQSGATRLVATVHDTVSRSRPDLVDVSISTYLDHWTHVSCLIADDIVTVSNFSRSEIIRLYPADPQRLTVIPNATDADLRKVKRFGAADDGPYILYVGCVEEKKNVLDLIRGFAALLRRRPDLPHRLVVTGGTAGGDELDLAALAGEPEIAERVVQTGYVAFDLLKVIYGGASAFAYLSEYEGFGLPALEAMTVGVPTVVSNRASLPEVTDGGALVVDPHDAEDVARALDNLLSDRYLARDLTARGRAVADRYSWTESARRLAILYERVMHSDRREVDPHSIPKPPPEAL